VLCGLEGADTDICAANRPTYWGFSREINRSNEGVPQYFRMYIPPGTVSFGVTMFVSSRDAIAAFAHIGSVPVGLAGSYPEVYGRIPISSTYPPKDCWDYEIGTRNEGGHLTLSFYGDTDFISGTDPTFMNNYEKRWLYVKIINYTGGILESYQFRLNIKFSALETWYKTMNATPGAWDKLEATGSISPINPTPITQPVVVVPPATDTSTGSITGGANGSSNYTPSASGCSIADMLLGTCGIPSAPVPVTTLQPYTTSLTAKSFNTLASQGPTIDSTYSQSVITLQPHVSGVTLTQGTEIKYYAAYTDSTGLYFATQSSQFQKWDGKATEFPYYKTGTFDGVNQSVTAYDTLGQFTINDKTFVFGVAPDSVNSIQEFVDHFQGVWLKFPKPDPCGVTGGTGCRTL